jgi:transcriptional regulator with XRE-family HTH domain
MLSATLREGLTEYAIGEKLRALRLRKKMGLVELGAHTGLSPALLSKLERGRIFPTLPTLLRIALVFGVGLDYFFAGAREKPMLAVARKAGRVALPERANTREIAYRFESLDYGATERRFNAYYAEFLPQSKDRARPHSHPGVEFLYVLEGTLELHIGDQEQRLEAGDAIYFDSQVPHAYRRAGTRSCSAVVITAP